MDRMPEAAGNGLSAARALTGLVLVGYGILVITDLLAHESVLAGILATGLGVVLLWPGLPQVRVGRARLVAALGASLALGVLAFNLTVGSGLGVPEWGILLYGVGLVGAASVIDRRLGRVDVASLVGWSFPVLLAPLGLFALNGVLTDDAAGAAASPLVRWLVVLPSAVGLRLLGTPVDVSGTTLILPTDRGSLSLGVGLVCAGLYPVVLFAGLAGLHAWQNPTQRRRMTRYIAWGLVGLWFLNLVRLAALAKVGQEWGGATLQQAHANLGWILFALYMALFWWLVFRRTDAKPAPLARAG